MKPSIFEKIRYDVVPHFDTYSRVPSAHLVFADDKLIRKFTGEGSFFAAIRWIHETQPSYREVGRG